MNECEQILAFLYFDKFHADFGGFIGDKHKLLSTMVFNSFQFLWLFPLIFLGYYFLPCLFTRSPERKSNVANKLLLLVSYGLYMQWNPAYALILLGVTAVTYFFALLLERESSASGRRRQLIGCGTLLALLPLLVFKYYNFLIGSFAEVLGWNGMPGLNWAVPIGISFFTFQAVGYLFDVYYRRIAAEHNWWDYMLFVSFFPQILSGPISKAGSLLPQIKSNRIFDYNHAVQGLKWMLWGMFLKTVMADRLGLYVDKILDNWQYNTGSSCLLASVFYSFQIYGDFAGYSFLAMGVGRLMGFDLVNNFRQPYLSVSVTDFWRRWHISLSTWLKDYVYIPLGGSRCGKARNYWNIFVTFLVSGVWHGANWTFVVWGVLHGLFQIAEKALGLQRPQSKGPARAGRIALTFLLVNFAWIVFRMPSIGDAWGVMGKIATGLVSPVYMESKTNILLSFASILMVTAVDCTNEFAPGKRWLVSSPHRTVRWASYVILAFAILLCGVFDAGQFIYVSF